MTDEELELFPTSESALKMLSYVTPGFYDKSYVGKWMFQVMGLEYDKALKRRNYRNSFSRKQRPGDYAGMK